MARSTPKCAPPKLKNCHNCGVRPSQFHEPGCDVERCSRCGFQAISCYCIYAVNHMEPDTLERDHPDVYRHGPTSQMLEQWDLQWGADRVPWSGEWPGNAEAQEYGFWCRWGDGTDGFPVGGPWVPCGPNDPGAVPDLNRLYTECVWSVEQKRMVKRSPECPS